ncbi:arginase [Litoreibacter halocynthiae]|uniref:arginase n=1 Tax=Litoreibacter halocynthiae TaxID=1242689 RepID=UPI00248FAE01|nr:arginase [Litoreibacter halocynthiae]
MTSKSCTLIGAPVQSGASQPGCVMGPDAFRTARLAETLGDLGHSVSDIGNVTANDLPDVTHANGAIHDLAQTVAWAKALETAAFDAAQSSDMPIFLGGDHSLSIGTVPGIARHWASKDRPLFVLWLDAHPDFHTLDSTSSGNLHGTPVAYFSGLPGFDVYPPLAAPVDPANLCMLGIRSVDPAENAALAEREVDVSDMRAIDEHGIAAPLRAFLERVREADGALHVSLDVDFLEPSIAPAVGTTVPGGATFREAHLVMEMLCDSGLVTSLDMVELNPFLDERGRTASLMVDLCASLMGRKVLDRQTKRF